MNRPSEQLRRGFELAGRKRQSEQLANALRAGMAYGLGELRFTDVRGSFTGAVMFEAQINGHAFRVTVEAIDRASAGRIDWNEPTGDAPEAPDTVAGPGDSPT